jgi:hypothetical protein
MYVIILLPYFFKVANHSTARDLFESAGHLLGYNLLKVCLEGPQELLNQTKYCQPAVLVRSGVDLMLPFRPKFFG